MLRKYGIRVDGLSQATRLSSRTLPLASGGHLPWREEMMDDETVDICTVFFLSVVSLIGLNGCNRQDPPPNAQKKLPQVPDTAVGRMARSAIDKAKRVEAMLKEQAIGQPRPVRKGRRKLEV